MRRLWCILCYHLAARYRFGYGISFITFRMYCRLLPWAADEAQSRGDFD